MCSGPKRKPCLTGLAMEGGEIQTQEGLVPKFSVLLELAAFDDLVGFRSAVEQEGCDVDESGCWYGRRIGSKKMGYDERTPLMIASMFASKQVLRYILETDHVDINRACGSDGATALHCAVSGGSDSSLEVVKILLDASADVNSVDAEGNKPANLITPILNSSLNTRRIKLKLMLKKGCHIGQACDSIENAIVQMEEQKDQEVFSQPSWKDGSERKEYPVDPSLPDISNWMYATDEFRMYSFKVKPCSRAYSHDWTECPFVHPGENARRRDPRKYQYSCVPCPEFRKGTCLHRDACDYAHGIFECWLHPAQYRTRICKDETSCTRRVCFFAHKPEELRPLYSSTGSGIPSPSSFSSSACPLDIASISQLTFGSPSVMMPPTSTPPMSPTASSLIGPTWPNLFHPSPPALQLPGSRLKTSVNARDMDAELLELESRHRYQQQLLDKISTLSPRSYWKDTNGLAGVKSTSLDDVLESMDPTILPRLQSPNGMQMHQNMTQQLPPSYTSRLPSPMRASPSFGFDQFGATATVLNARSSAFAKRSQSFIDRSAVNWHSGPSSPASATVLPPSLSDWGSPDGKLDWGIQKEELNKLRKSASFGLRSSRSSLATLVASSPTIADEPDGPQSQSLVKDVSSLNHTQYGLEDQEHQQYPSSGGVPEMLAPWVEKVFMDQEKIMA